MRRRFFSMWVLLALTLAASPASAQGVLLLDDSPGAETRRRALESLFDGERSVTRQAPPGGVEVSVRDTVARQRAADAEMLAAVWLTESTVRVVLPREPGTAHATLRPDADAELFARLAGALIDQFLRHAERAPVRIIGVQGFLDELGGDHPVTRIQGLDAFDEAPPAEDGTAGSTPTPVPAQAEEELEDPATVPVSTFALEAPPEPEWDAHAAASSPPELVDPDAFVRARDTGFVGIGTFGATMGGASGRYYGGGGLRGRAGYLFGEYVRVGASASLVMLGAMDQVHPFFSTCAEASASLPVDSASITAGVNACLAAGLVPEQLDRTEAAFGSGSLVLAVSTGIARRFSLWGIVELGVAGGGQLPAPAFLGTAALELRIE